MGMVHPACVSLCKDNVFWLWCAIPWGFEAGDVNHSLTWFFRLLRVSISRASAILDLARSPKYHPDISSFRCMLDISLVTSRYIAYMGERFWQLSLCSLVA